MVGNLPGVQEAQGLIPITTEEKERREGGRAESRNNWFSDDLGWKSQMSSVKFLGPNQARAGQLSRVMGLDLVP